MEFKYFMPTQLVVGKDSIIKNSHQFKTLGKKVLIVSGKYSAKKNGALDDVMQALNSEGIGHVLFDQIEENPSLETIEAGAKVGIRECVDFVIGIGGGSPLDAAKAISVMIKNPNLTTDALLSMTNLEILPVIAIPTTAGTGSEVTQYAILTDHKARTKKNLGQGVFPKVAFLDAKYMADTPDYIMINTALDALSHLVESYLSVKSNFMSEVFVIKGITLWGECIDAIKNRLFDEAIREKLLLASTLGGMAIANTGTSLPHGMGYHLTYFKGVPHGLANMVLYTAYFNAFKNKEKINMIYKLLGLDTDKAFEEFLKELVKLDVAVTKEELQEWTESMIANKAKLANHPEQVDYDTIYNIYKKSLLRR